MGIKKKVGRASGKLTKRQAIILRELKKLKTHPAANNFYNLIKIRCPRINFAGLARDLDALVKKGLVQDIGVEGDVKRYDGNPQSHYHVVCMDCGRVDDISINIIAAMDRAVSIESGFEIIKHAIIFYGLCGKCRENAERRR